MHVGLSDLSFIIKILQSPILPFGILVAKGMQSGKLPHGVELILTFYIPQITYILTQISAYHCNYHIIVFVYCTME